MVFISRLSELEQPTAAKSSPTKSSAKSIAVVPAGTSEAVLPSQDSVISLLNESWGGDEKSKTAVINSINDLHHQLCSYYKKKLFDAENNFERRMTLLQNKIEELEEKHERLEEKFNRFVENLALNLAQLGVNNEKIKEVISNFDFCLAFFESHSYSHHNNLCM